MKLPTLTQLARSQATFVKYQDGKLWYQVIWLDDDHCSHLFDFPIPVNEPDLREAMAEVSDAIHIAYAPYTTMRTLDDVQDMLAKALKRSTSDGAGGGEFGAVDKSLRFMRWIRKHLDFLRESGADMEPT